MNSAFSCSLMLAVLTTLFTSCAGFNPRPPRIDEVEPQDNREKIDPALRKHMDACSATNEKECYEAGVALEKDSISSADSRLWYKRACLGGDKRGCDAIKRQTQKACDNRDNSDYARKFPECFTKKITQFSAGTSMIEYIPLKSESCDKKLEQKKSVCPGGLAE